MRRNADRPGFRVETSDGTIDARYVVAATGPFQRPVIPPIVPGDAGLVQIHSSSYRNPRAVARRRRPRGRGRVIGGADRRRAAAVRAARSSSPSARTTGPRVEYRGRDYCWWLGVLGLWDAETLPQGREHVTIAVSGAHGGATVDFRALAASGITLVGRTASFDDGDLRFAPGPRRQHRRGDANT